MRPSSGRPRLPLPPALRPLLSQTAFSELTPTASSLIPDDRLSFPCFPLRPVLVDSPQTPRRVRQGRRRPSEQGRRGLSLSGAPCSPLPGVKAGARCPSPGRSGLEVACRAVLETGSKAHQPPAQCLDQKCSTNNIIVATSGYTSSDGSVRCARLRKTSDHRNHFRKSGTLSCNLHLWECALQIFMKRHEAQLFHLRHHNLP